jgi:hypothetical protein
MPCLEVHLVINFRPVTTLPQPPKSSLLGPIELLIDQMEEEVDVQPQLPLKHVHELIGCELCFENTL